MITFCLNVADLNISKFVLLTGRKSGKGIFVYTQSAKERDENVGAVDILKRYSTVSQQPYVVSSSYCTSVPAVCTSASSFEIIGVFISRVINKSSVVEKSEFSLQLKRKLNIENDNERQPKSSASKK